MNNIFVLFIAIILISGNPLYAQFSLTNDGTIADSSAMLDVKSTNRGALIPRMTQAQIGNIENPANGLLVFCTTDNKLYTFIATDNNWKEILYGTGTITPPPISCGNPITINHSVSFGVAPVDKQVTYGTVTGIPGEPTKCWITCNLGADHQANAVNDATEASAGWYWQFNRKQGYKHDGTTRTPNTYWINDINEASDWIISNDPCNIEFGANWRIPTYTEWYNVDNNDGWINWNGPWGSGLKLHAAGNLYFFSGSLYDRGSDGFYWSSMRNNTGYGLGLTFDVGYSSMSDYLKAYGFSIRCLKDAGSSSTPTVATSSISNITDTSASSGGNVTSGGGATVTARGVCWSTSSNPTIADSHTTDGSGTGSFLSDLTGLTLNTIYFVRAYATNSFGTVYGNEETFETLNPCPGIETITINHLVSGGVAPVNKTVTYGTAINISGDNSKCWITSNLGADHLATDVSDDTEASAGWYWQFNHKQGYKHDGTARRPNTTWITSISENSDWTTANDPCNIELGTTWHIPTYTEWYNVDNTGGWTNWNDPWGSGLKLHAAGFLEYHDGSLLNRGSYGIYWSSSQSSATGGWFLYFDSGLSYMNVGASKAYGYSVRCLRDVTSSSTTPSVTTSSISNITLTSASSGGNVTSDGGSYVTARGVCWSTSSNPTIADSHSTDGSGTGTFVSSLTGLTANTFYYFRAYTTNSVGTSYGDQGNFTTILSFAIGQSYGGGIIFYIDGSGQHGLISATTDQSDSAQWGCSNTIGTSTVLGTGQANTTLIVNGCSTAGIAARICDDLVLDGYSDWFLPSKDELNLMYIQKIAIGGFIDFYYWSSSEYTNEIACIQDFTNGTQGSSYKYAKCRVRAVRAF